VLSTRRDEVQLDKSLEPTRDWYWIEMGRVGRKLVNEFFPVKEGENVVVTADSMSDTRVVQETVKAIYAAGAIPTLIVHPITKEATSDPPPPVAAALPAADAWIEMSGGPYLLYSNAWKKAMEAGVRYFAHPGDVDSSVRMVGQVDYSLLDRLANTLVELSLNATEMHITSALGTDLRVKVDPSRAGGHVMKAGEGMLADLAGEGTAQVPPGQCDFGDLPGSHEGTLVFDGAVYPPSEIGVLREPVRLEISNGRVTQITGGYEAKAFEKWLAGWDHPAMYEIAHCSYGLNPGVKRCKGEIGHDERVFGCMEFGIGAAWAGAPAHTDGVMLAPSIWADDLQIEEEGRYVHPELVELCRALGVEGY
jgi:leucyl aminopeptidase (aminopeptidase T)